MSFVVFILVIVGEKNIPECQQFVESNAELSEPIGIPLSLMMLAVICFDEAAKLFHKLGEESLLFFTLCVCVFFFLFLNGTQVFFL